MVNPEQVNPSLLAILVCPVCRGPLQQEQAALRCARCSRSYPVRDGIPDMVVDDPDRGADASPE